MSEKILAKIDLCKSLTTMMCFTQQVENDTSFCEDLRDTQITLQQYLRTEASVRMLVYVVNILMMFAGPASCGDVTEAGLADAAILSTIKTEE